MGYHISPCVVDHDTGCNVGQYGFMKTVILHRYPLHLRKTLGNAVERAVYLRIGRFRETQRRVAGIKRLKEKAQPACDTSHIPISTPNPPPQNQAEEKGKHYDLTDAHSPYFFILLYKVCRVMPS